MAITTTAKLEVGRHGSKYNFTSRMLSFSTELVVDWAKCGQAKCTFTLRNTDGALTPGAGGTYTSLDWFNQGVWLWIKSDNGTNNSEVLAFGGLVNDISFDDDGTWSTVTITAVDVMTKGGQNTTVTRTAYADDLMGDSALNPLRTTPGGFKWPKLTNNATSNISELVVFDYGASTRTTAVATGQTVTIQGARSYLEQSVLPGGPAVMWPKGITTTDVTLVGSTDWEYALIMVDFKRAVAKKVALTFDDYRSTISGGDLPFTDIEVGFNTEQLINRATINRPGGIAQTQDETASQDKYGIRAVSYTQVQSTTNTRSANIASKITKRYEIPSFEPLSVTVKASTVNRYAADAAYDEWATVLSMAEAPYQQASITWTATGGSSQTKTCSVRGRKITGNPQDLTVTVYFTYKEV